MKALKSLLAAVMVITSATGFAQFTNVNNQGSTGNSTTIEKGYDRIGVSYNSMSYKCDWDDGEDDFSLNGVGFEWIHGFNIAKSIPLYIETGAKFLYGFKSESENIDEDWTIDNKYKSMSISVPVNIAYRFTLPNNNNISITPYTGITLKGNIAFKQTLEDDDEKVEYDYFDKDDVGDDGTANRFQFGWHIGAGITFNQFYVGLNYGIDTSEFAKKINTSTFALTVGIEL